MQQAKKFYIVAFYFFLLTGLFGCGSLPQSSLRLGVDVTNIRDLKPRGDNNATVNLQGKVIKQVPLLLQRVYQLQDSTGTIWVLTNQTTPQPGDQVSITGQVHYQSIPLAGKEFGEVYLEQRQ